MPFEKSAIPVIPIAISNVCNLQCPMCETHLAKTTKGFMSFGLFEQVVKEIKKIKIKLVSLHNVNEPILHPEIIGFLNLLEKEGLNCWLSSNGQALDSFISRLAVSTVRPNRLMFRFSIDGADRDVYEEMRQGGSWDKLLSNLRLLKQFCGAERIMYSATVNCIITKKTSCQIGTFYKIFKDFFGPNGFYFSFLGGNSIRGVNRFIRENAMTPLKFRPPCDVPFTQMSIHYDGKVSICCNDFNQESIVGQFPHQSLMQIWNNGLFERYRNAHSKKKFQNLPANCRRCYWTAYSELGESVNGFILSTLKCCSDEFVCNEKIYAYLTSLNQ